MIYDRFLKTIQKFRMIEKGDRVLVAVSGGRDSVTLLYLLSQLKHDWKLQLGILHVNHKLRGKASDQDEAFVRHLGKKLKVPVYVERALVRRKAKEDGLSLEEAAREVRYAFFEKMAEAKHVQKVAVAHTQDDQAETVLMRVIVGTGLQGLQAIRPKRKLDSAYSGTYLVRPLIEIPRREIEQFTKKCKLKHREDKSNNDTKFLRNRIRLKLLPFLEKSFNPQVKHALARLPHLLDVDLAFLEETADLFYKRLAQKRHGNEIIFPRQSFLQLRPSIQYRLISRAMRAVAEAELDFEHWNELIERILTSRRAKVQLPKGVLASISPESIRIRKRSAVSTEFSHLLSPGDELHIPEINATVLCEKLAKRPRVVRKSDQSFELLDGCKLQFPLEVRNRKPGDRFQPLGQGKPLKLKGFLINKQVPSEERDLLPLVLSQDRIAWIGGLAMGEAYKISPRTRQFVRISLKQNSLQ
jgi:tRNA(Ile)-lysidine synthase